MHKAKLRAVLVIISLVLIYLILEISFLKLPGIYCDEVLHAKFSLDIKEFLRQHSFIELFLRKVTTPPLMLGLHDGMLDSFILVFITYLLPFLSINVVSARLMVVFFGALTIILTYLFTKKLFSKGYALLTILLLVLNPGFIMGTKVGTYSGTIMATIYMAVLCLLLKWYRLKKNIYFFIAMFLLGLGMWTRIWFFWFIVGISLTAVVFIRDIRQRFEIKKYTGFLKYILLGAIFFSLGCFVIIHQELTSNFSITKYLLSSARNPALSCGYYHNNLEYLSNLSIIMSNFRDILTGKYYFLEHFREPGNQFINNLYPWAILLSIAYLFILIVIKKNYPYRKKILFILVLFVGMLVFTPVTIGQLASYHFYLFFPIVQLIISIAIISLIQYFKKFKVIVIVVIASSVLLLSKELIGLKGYFYYLKNNGGIRLYSSAVYDLTDYLLKEKATNVIVGDWGLNNIIELNSGGRIEPIERFQPEQWNLANAQELFIKNKNSLYVFYAKEASSHPPNLENFLTVAKQLNLNFIEKKVFYEKDGTPVYFVMALKENNKEL